MLAAPTKYGYSPSQSSPDRPVVGTIRGLYSSVLRHHRVSPILNESTSICPLISNGISCGYVTISDTPFQLTLLQKNNSFIVKRAPGRRIFSKESVGPSFSTAYIVAHWQAGKPCQHPFTKVFWSR